jgi:hypothetical protein
VADGDELDAFHLADQRRPEVAERAAELPGERIEEGLPLLLRAPLVDQRHDLQPILIGRVPEMVELISHVGHVDAVYDLAKVRSTRIRPDHGHEIWISRALRDGGDVEKTLMSPPARAVLIVLAESVLFDSQRCRGARRRSRDERDDERSGQRHHAGERRQPDNRSSPHRSPPGRLDLEA